MMIEEDIREGVQKCVQSIVGYSYLYILFDSFL